VDADGEARTQRGERGLRRVRRGVVAEQSRRLVDHVGRQAADEIEMAESALGDRLAFQRLDGLGIGLALGDQLVEALSVDGGETAGEGGLGDGLVHELPLLWLVSGRYRPFCSMHEPCHSIPSQKVEWNQETPCEQPGAYGLTPAQKPVSLA